MGKLKKREQDSYGTNESAWSPFSPADPSTALDFVQEASAEERVKVWPLQFDDQLPDTLGNLCADDTSGKWGFLLIVDPWSQLIPRYSSAALQSHHSLNSAVCFYRMLLVWNRDDPERTERQSEFDQALRDFPRTIDTVSESDVFAKALAAVLVDFRTRYMSRGSVIRAVPPVPAGPAPNFAPNRGDPNKMPGGARRKVARADLSNEDSEDAKPPPRINNSVLQPR